MTDEDLYKAIDTWFKEDVGDGDHTTLSCIPVDAIGTQELLCKEEGVLAGVRVAKAILKHRDPALQVTLFKSDGDLVVPGDVAFEVHGRVQSMLQIERTMLNVMQHMSGIATTTRKYQARIADTGCFVLDTRKTTPGLRDLEKEAVRIGGGRNHRRGLYDMILLKDNHVDFAGGITQALESAKQYVSAKGLDLKIEIETRNEREIREALGTAIPDRIMLDNFSVEATREAVKFIRSLNKTIEIESSGGITFDTLRDYALCGVTYISVGALTHSVKNLDLSFKAKR